MMSMMMMVMMMVMMCTQIMKARSRLSEMDPSVLHKVFCRFQQSKFRHLVTVSVLHACAAQALHSQSMPGGAIEATELLASDGRYVCIIHVQYLRHRVNGDR